MSFSTIKGTLLHLASNCQSQCTLTYSCCTHTHMHLPTLPCLYKQFGFCSFEYSKSLTITILNKCIPHRHMPSLSPSPSHFCKKPILLPYIILYYASCMSNYKEQSNITRIMWSSLFAVSSFVVLCICNSGTTT